MTDSKGTTMFKYDFSTPAPPPLNLTRPINLVVLDTETTGFDYKKDRLIEVAAVHCVINPDSLESVGLQATVKDEYTAFQDPGITIPPETTKIHGITNDMVSGHSAASDKLDYMLRLADVVVAHNASFDRGFVRQICSAEPKRWSCSRARIDWTAHQFQHNSQRYLSLEHGVAGESAHRALDDCHTLIRLLNSNPIHSLYRPHTGPNYIEEMLANTKRPVSVILLTKTGFDANAELRKRQYIWSPKRKAWWKSVYKDCVKSEGDWLSHDVFKDSELFWKFDVINDVDDLSPEFRSSQGLD